MEPVSTSKTSYNTVHLPEQSLLARVGSFCGRVLTVTGLKHQIHSVFEKAYGCVIRDPQWCLYPESDALSRKVEKLTLTGRPFLSKTGFFVLDRLGFTGPVLIYDSAGPLVNLNSSVLREGERTLTTCRHLAYAYAKGQFGRGEKKFSTIDSEDKLAAYPFIPGDKELDRIFFHNGCPARAVYFSIDQWGYVLSHEASKLKAGEERRYLLFAVKHAMALCVEKKLDGHFLIYFYDPNNTLRHLKVMARSEEDLNLLTADDFLKGGEKDYFPDGRQTVLLSSLSTASNRDESHITFLAEPQSDAIHQLLSYGHYGHPDLAISFTELTREQILGKISTRSVTGLYKACKNGHRQAVKSYLTDILSSDLDDKTKVETINDNAVGIKPGLFEAVVNEHEDVVTEYINRLAESTLVDSDVLAILLVEHDGMTCFQKGKVKGRDALLAKVTKVIRKSRFSECVKGELIHHIETASSDLFSYPGWKLPTTRSQLFNMDFCSATGVS